MGRNLCSQTPLQPSLLLYAYYIRHRYAEAVLSWKVHPRDLLARSLGRGAVCAPLAQCSAYYVASWSEVGWQRIHIYIYIYRNTQNRITKNLCSPPVVVDAEVVLEMVEGRWSGHCSCSRTGGCFSRSG